MIFAPPMPAEMSRLREYAQALPTPARCVIDSNVWIDILVFDDQDSRAIRDALLDGVLDAIISLPCRAELEHVLAYPQFAARTVDIAQALAWVDRHTRRLDGPADGAAPRALPQCRDPDDQKFLELARDGAAHWLISKDKALLRLKPRIARDFGFQIVTAATFSRLGALPAPPGMPE